MKFLRNRTVLGILCIVIALLICFVITPMMNRGLSAKTTIVRMKSNVKSGTLVTGKMVEAVEVGGYNLPESVVKDTKDIVGKYLAADLYEGDYVLSEKLSDTPAKENEYLYTLDGKKQAMSVTLNTFAEGVSGKLMSGDIISVIVPDYLGTGETIIPSELKYVEVIAVTAKSGNDANTDSSARVSEEESKELPSTVTVLVTPEQSKILAMIEADSEMHLSLVYRGDRENAKKFVEAQDVVLEKIKELLKEAEEAEQAGKTDNASSGELQVIGEEGTTIISGSTRKKSGSLIVRGNKIASSKLPANASTGSVEIEKASEIVNQ
ncbi:MAG: Flp pilus assembly protein CpaB [Acetatifactor sp.]